MSPLCLAAAETAEEAIFDSMFKSDGTKGKDGRFVKGLPLEKLKAILGR